MPNFLLPALAPQVLNLTRSYLSLHLEFVVPLLQKYAQEWSVSRNPVYRPLWWLTPDDPYTLTIDNQFLIGDEVGYSICMIIYHQRGIVVQTG